MNAEKFTSFLIESSKLPPLLNKFPSPKLHLALELTVVLSNTNMTKYRFISSVLLQCSSASSTDLTVLTTYAKTRLEESDRWKRATVAACHSRKSRSHISISSQSRWHHTTKRKWKWTLTKSKILLSQLFFLFDFDRRKGWKPDVYVYILCVQEIIERA